MRTLEKKSVFVKMQFKKGLPGSARRSSGPGYRATVPAHGTGAIRSWPGRSGFPRHRGPGHGRYLRDPNRELLKEDLTRNDERKPMPPRFDADFVKRLHLAIENGRMTANRAAELLDMDRDELLGLFTEHHLTDPINS